jgi:hypothetical protein
MQLTAIEKKSKNWIAKVQQKTFIAAAFGGDTSSANSWF